MNTYYNRNKLIIRLIYLALGFLTLGLGMAGIMLPVLPTTPFLLLSAFFFARSSQKFYLWLLNNPIFGNYLQNYLQNKGIPLRVKIYALSLLWISIGISSLILIKNMVIVVLLVLIAIAVSIHILRIKTL